uniref:CFAP74 fourth Ig-like domain-containing protein n=1 Tax=Dendroctonus ponderosae TaxID=77166 RepID=A0AAR5QG06_DENPD
MMSSCYQLSFQLCNGSSGTQAISVRVPAPLKNVVRAGSAMVYMPPNSQRTVLVKLVPRELLYEDGCQQFDKSNSILSFNIHLYVASQPLQDYPPVKVPVYAIVANFQDLTIACIATRHMSNFLNTVLIDVGDCSIYETLWTEIHLTNNTALMQVCAFMDLPQAVVLEPSFGFCKLLPGQRRQFKVYISPEVRDFPSYSIGSLRNCNYFFKLMVDTVASIGQVATVSA